MAVTFSGVRQDETGSYLTLLNLCGFPTFGLSAAEYRKHIWQGLKQSATVREELAYLSMAVAGGQADFADVSKYMDEGQEEVLLSAITWLTQFNFDYEAAGLKVEG